MIITADRISISLVEPEDLRRLHVLERVRRSPESLDELLRVAGVGFLADEHAFVLVDWLRSETSAHVDVEEFDRLIALAERHGWLSDDKRHVQAHIETQTH